MFKNLSNKKGFTLIELVIVMVILGILAAVSTPMFTDMSAGAEAKATQGLVASVRSAQAIQIGNNVASNINPVYPTVTVLASKVTPAGTVSAGNTGIDFSVNGKTVQVKTYTDDACTVPTSAATSLVQCAK